MKAVKSEASGFFNFLYVTVIYISNSEFKEYTLTETVQYCEKKKGMLKTKYSVRASAYGKNFVGGGG